MGNLFTKQTQKQKQNMTLPLPDVIQKIQQEIDKIKNLSNPCCGKADIRFDSTDRLIECTNCQRQWV